MSSGKSSIMAQDKSESAAAARLLRVAARGHATTIFRPGAALAINYLIDDKPVKLVFRTRYLDRGFAVPVAGDMWVDAEGEAESLENALMVFSNAARDMAAVIALVMNAAIAPLEPEIVLETTSGIDRRPSFNVFLPTGPAGPEFTFCGCRGRYLRIGMHGEPSGKGAPHAGDQPLHGGAKQMGERFGVADRRIPVHGRRGA